jgi:signal transduction histidine kinase
VNAGIGWVSWFRSSVTRGSFLEAYLVFPVLIWAALRFEQRGTTLVVFLSSVTAIAATVRGSGPFSQQELHGSLLALQTFVGIVATSLLLLAATLAERTRVKRELERAVKAETDANQAKSDFLAVMSHELRTPLNAISGYSQMLSMEVLGPLNPAQRDAVDRIASNESHLASLVEDVLSFTPSHAGKLDLDIQKVNVRKSLEAMEVFMQPQLQKKGINLVIDAADENLVAAADPDRLRQILLNLLTNSLKYTERGGEIRVVATRDNGVCVDVIDTGVGIPADQLGRVFEPFFQVDRGRTRRFEGVGLGLSIARDLVGAMKGEISIKSTESIGTAVRIRLPEA